MIKTYFRLLFSILVLYSRAARASEIHVMPTFARPQANKISVLFDYQMYSEKNRCLYLGADLGAESFPTLKGTDKSFAFAGISFGWNDSLSGIDSAVRAIYRVQIGTKKKDLGNYLYANQRVGLIINNLTWGVDFTLNEHQIKIEENKVEIFTVAPYFGWQI